MYQINKNENKIIKLEQRLFSDLGIKEREHLQEWIAHNPDVLGGENLLIIQKEYDGFNDTNERLDLLALDDSGNLVIIENKLDDTGRDVVWQALKYTSYCSTLTTSQIVKLYQEYLDRYEEPNQDAKSLILEFLDIEDEEALLLNTQDQRMIFVANHYRKEVTSTVVWLLKHKIQIQCFKATPYSLDNELFLQIEQIIPQPELKEFMIDATEKEEEDKGKSKVVEETKAQLIEFWRLVKSDLQNHQIHHFDNVSPKPSFSYGFWKGKAKFAMVIGRYVPRVEIYFSDDKEKRMFDAMASYKDEIEERFDGEITWQRLDNKKASRIKYDMPKELHETMSAWRDTDAINDRIVWYRETFEKFYKVVYPVWEKVQKQLG